MVKVSLIGALRRRRAPITPCGALLAVAAAGAALGAAPAAAAPEPTVYDSPRLWATVNFCDTEEHPDTIGIRGSMPGSGIADERMLMRFQLQYFDRTDEKWHNVGASGDSGFVPVGSARFRSRQSGRNFTVRPPAGGSYLLRGAVTFEWRLDRKVVRRARRSTTGGRGQTTGADPKGFSAARCTVRD